MVVELVGADRFLASVRKSADIKQRAGFGSIALEIITVNDPDLGLVLRIFLDKLQFIKFFLHQSTPPQVLLITSCVNLSNISCK